MRLIAAGLTCSSSAAAAKLPPRPAASKARMPLRKGRRRMLSLRKADASPGYLGLCRGLNGRMPGATRNSRMAPTTILLLAVVMTGTAFLSGIFGMAGGLVLIGVLLALLPLPEAMALHAVTQMASNGWRAFLWRRHIVWRPIAAIGGGFGLALLLWSLLRWVPGKPVALLALGVTPFLVKLLPKGLAPDPESP